MPVAIDVGQRVLVYNPSHGWTVAYFVTAQQTNDNKLQILVSNSQAKKTNHHFHCFRPVVYRIVITKPLLKIITDIHLSVSH